MAIDIRSLNGGQAPSQPALTDVKEGTKAPQPSPISRQPAESEAKAAASDSVRITSRARELQGLIGRLSQESAVDTDRVARLREEIGSGRYTVNSERVAARILGLERDLKRSS